MKFKFHVIILMDNSKRNTAISFPTIAFGFAATILGGIAAYKIYKRLRYNPNFILKDPFFAS